MDGTEKIEQNDAPPTDGSDPVEELAEPASETTIESNVQVNAATR
jgi:hypothetical protein